MNKFSCIQGYLFSWFKKKGNFETIKRKRFQLDYIQSVSKYLEKDGEIREEFKSISHLCHPVKFHWFLNCNFEHLKFNIQHSFNSIEIERNNFCSYMNLDSSHLRHCSVALISQYSDTACDYTVNLILLLHSVTPQLT